MDAAAVGAGGSLEPGHGFLDRVERVGNRLPDLVASVGYELPAAVTSR